MPGFGGGGLGSDGFGGFAVALADPVFGTGRWEPPFTTLLADLSPTATVIDVAYDLADYALPFDVVIGIEMCTVTARNTATNWTITRGARGSSALPAAERQHYADARVSALPHTIVAVKGATTWDYTAIAARSLTTREVSPGGELEATWELDTMQPAAWLPSIDAVVTISDEDGPYWSGLVARPSIVSKDQTTGAAHIKVVARGYIVTASWDGFEDSRVWPAYTAAHTIVEQSRNERMPLISTNNLYVVHGGQSMAQAVEGIGSTPRQLWDRVCAMGDVGEPLDFHVRTATDGLVNLHLLRRISQKTIRIPWATLADVPLDWDAELQRNKVVARWAKGRDVRTQGTSPTRWIYKDYSSQIDNLDLAYQIAGQILANSAAIAAIAGKPLVVEWPKEVYESDGVTPIPPWRIRAGWLVQLDGISAWNAALPIPLLQIKDMTADHHHHRVSLQLGARFDDLDIQAAFTAKEEGKLGGPVSGIIPQFVVPPEGVSTPVNYELVSFGASGRVGPEAIAEDFDISTIWVTIPDLTGATLPLRLEDIPIDVRMRVRGLRLKGHDGSLGVATVMVTVGHGIGSPSTYPAAGTTIAAITMTAAFEATKNLPENDAAAEHVTELAPMDYLSVTIEATPVPLPLNMTCSLGILVQRTDGSSRGTDSSAPTINSVSASRDANNDTTFLVTTNRLCRVQIEFGVDTTYGSRSQKSEAAHRVSTIVVSGLPTSGVHYRAHVTDIDSNENVSGDNTV